MANVKGIAKKAVQAVGDAGKNAAKAAGSAKNAVVKAIDYNDDGKFDIKDISPVANRIGEKREAERLEKEFNSLKPIFKETINSPEFSLPKLIRVADMDKKHADSVICQDSIGFKSEYDGLQIITIYPEYADLFGLRFYPDANSEVYYVDPCDRDYYISLDEYFKYLRLKKVYELQVIAQDLGAKHFRVSYVEQESSNSNSKIKVSANAMTKALPKSGFSGDYDHETESKKASKVEVAAEMDCLGHEPIEPTLHYLKGDPNIEAMIKMRLAKNAPLHQKVSVNLMSQSGIKVKDAAKIDGAMKGLHFNASTSIQRGAQSEARTILEYEIDY